MTESQASKEREAAPRSSLLQRFSPPAARRESLLLLTVVAVTLLFLGGVDFFSRHVLVIPNPGMLAAVVVALCAIRGGIRGGAAAAVTGSLYYIATASLAIPTNPVSASTTRLIVLSVSLLADGLLVGMLKRESEARLTDRLYLEHEHRLRSALSDAARKRAEDLSAILENIPTGVFLADSTHLTFMNRAARSLRGLQASSPLPPLGEVQKNAHPLARALQRDETASAEILLDTAEGRRLPAFCTATPLRDEAGALVSVLCTETNLTELREAQEESRQREREFATLAENLPDVIARYDRDLRLLYLNPAFEAMTRLPIAPLLGMRADENPHTQHGSSAQAWAEALRKVLTTGEDVMHEATVSWRDTGGQGQEKRFESLLVPECDASGARVGVLAVSRDVTDRYRATEALRASEQRLAQALEELKVTEARQRRIAETLQRSLLIEPVTSYTGGLSVMKQYAAAWDEAQIGGDFYDYFELENGFVALVVGDTTGKGLNAAASTAELKFSLRAYLREQPDPGAALTRLNQLLFQSQRYDQRSPSALVCLSVAVVETRTGETRITTAGSEPPLVLRNRADSSEEVLGNGLILGILPDAVYECLTLQLGADDLLLMATDGITEARQRSRDTGITRAMFGYEGFVRSAREAAQKTASLDASETVWNCDLEAIGTCVIEEARRFAGGALQDDVCLLIARRASDATIK